MPELFGCCSSYVECSDSGSCLHKSDPEYDGCYYRKNLEAGRIFYGKNAGKTVTKEAESVIETPEIVTEKPKTVPNWTKPEYHIYLTCYNQPFTVLHRHDIYRGVVSYQLRQDNFEKLQNLFDALNIPYITDMNQNEFRDQEAAEKQICDCRVTIEAGENKYNILNFDSLLIPEKVAEGIKKAFEVKGIPARVEKVGRWSSVEIPPYKTGMLGMKVVSIGEVKPKPPEPEEEKEVVYEQSSIFELIGA